MCFEFQHSHGFDGKSNYLQKFDNYNRGLLFFLLVRIIPICTTM